METKIGVGIEINLFEGTTLVKVSETDIVNSGKCYNPDKLTANENFHGISDEDMTSILWDKD